MQTGEEFILWHGKGLPNEILSIFWHKRIGKNIPKTHSGKLSKNEIPDSVRQ
jgi:hypothetical protein